MSVGDQILSGFSAQINRMFSPLKRRLFGANNETLDFIMDSFYKLSAEQRLGAIIGGSVFAVMLIGGIFIFYFSQVGSLENELNHSFNALHELRTKK